MWLPDHYIWLHCNASKVMGLEQNSGPMSGLCQFPHGFHYKVMASREFNVLRSVLWISRRRLYQISSCCYKWVFLIQVCTATFKQTSPSFIATLHQYRLLLKKPYCTAPIYAGLGRSWKVIKLILAFSRHSLASNAGRRQNCTVRARLRLYRADYAAMFRAVDEEVPHDMHYCKTSPS